MNEFQRSATVNIDLDALAFNFHAASKFIGDDVKYMAVVKADAYGHDAVACSKRLEKEGADWLAVALPEEGIELREAGIKIPILCLRGYEGSAPDDLLKYHITPVLYQPEKIAEFNKSAAELEVKVKIHVKIDTGMGRVGVRFDEIDCVLDALTNAENLTVQGLMTHFAAADDPEKDLFSQMQTERFYNCVERFRDVGIEPEFFDLANSPAAIAMPGTRGNMVRLGGILYGLIGDVLPPGIDHPETKPVLSLRTSVSSLRKIHRGETVGYGQTFSASRETLVATVPLGYADGLMRSLSNRGSAIVGDRIVPIIGRISMDWATLDVTDCQNVKIGDEAVFIGSSKGIAITAEEMAKAAGTISYEITCDLNQRVAKTYKS